MNIRYITCSDLREHIPIDEAVKLLNINPRVELGIQAHNCAMNTGLPRHAWFDKLVKISERLAKPLNLALHVNGSWCTRFCNYDIPQDLRSWMDSKNQNTSLPTVGRWQLNIGDNTGKIDIGKLADVIKNGFDHNCELIIPYNIKTAGLIDELDKKDAAFSLLFDESYGVGKSPSEWRAPVYDNHPQGYSGGLCGDNIMDNLDKISKVVTDDRPVWIDAEGRLMQPGTRIFDIARAKNYISNILAWLDKNNTR
ncbi:MAG: hypothetical protein LBF37_04280 [Rickettsiales bacterium]|jgi:hypothetical protein|nr:hypothetical protein [Rickettsiales bacterium]